MDSLLEGEAVAAGDGAVELAGEVAIGSIRGGFEVRFIRRSLATEKVADSDGTEVDPADRSEANDTSADKEPTGAGEGRWEGEEVSGRGPDEGGAVDGSIDGFWVGERVDPKLGLSVGE